MATAKKKKSSSAKSINDAVKVLDKAMMAMKRKQYPKAKDILEGLKAEYSHDLEIRGKILTLLKICENKIEEDKGTSPLTAKSSPTDIYDQGIFLHNNLEYKEALDCFEKGLKKAGDNPDHFFYAIAASHARLGNFKESAEILKQAVEISRENLFKAQNDPNFCDLREETEIWETVDNQEDEETEE